MPTFREAGGAGVYVQCLAGSTACAGVADGVAAALAVGVEVAAVALGFGVAEAADADLPPPPSVNIRSVLTPPTMTTAAPMKPASRHRCARCARRTCWRW